MDKAHLGICGVFWSRLPGAGSHSLTIPTQPRKPLRLQFIVAQVPRSAPAVIFLSTQPWMLVASSDVRNDAGHSFYRTCRSILREYNYLPQSWLYIVVLAVLLDGLPTGINPPGTI